MESVTRPAGINSPRGHSLSRRQIRGSSLLLAGRFISVGGNFASQVLVVRYLSTADYGAWAYALAVIAFFQGIATLGLDRAITRFVPIYHEKREYDKLFGTILLAISSTLVIGLVAVAAFYAFPGGLSRLINDRQQPLTLLFILIFLVPVDALDGLLIGLFAGFSNSRAIFFRRYVLAPGLKLGVVLLLVLRRSEVTFLAYGYLSASLAGVLIFSWELIRMFRREGLLEKFKLSRIRVPAREIFGFTVPLLSSDLVTILMHSSDAVLLGYFCDLKQVAFFRVVLPAAALNQMVIRSFGLLYTPATARLFAKEDYEGINNLYWRTAVWMSVLTFPIFAVTFCLATPLTLLLYGPRYQQSGIIMALLSLGYYFNVVLGNNGLTLKVLGKLRYIVTINILAAAANVLINLLLIPRYGALGAGIGTASTLIIFNVLKQAGLRLASGISLFDRRYSSFYVTILLSVGALLLVRLSGLANIYVLLCLAGIATLLVLALTRKLLAVEETFPEVAKLPLIRAFLT